MKPAMTTSFEIFDCGYGEQCPMLASRSSDLIEVKLVMACSLERGRNRARSGYRWNSGAKMQKPVAVSRDAALLDSNSMAVFQRAG